MTTKLMPRSTVPPLVDGDVLSADEYLRRYWAMPDTRAELIEGVVFMGSPISADHNFPLHATHFWLGGYQFLTPGVQGLVGSTVRLATRSIPEPDAGLYIPAERGGQVRVGADRLFVGVPELAIEVSVSSTRRDLGLKRQMYETAGVREYLVVQPRDGIVEWLVNTDGGFQPLPLTEDGQFRSHVFPGLWLDPAALLGRDLHALQAAVQRGCQTPEHAAFVARLNPPVS